MAARKNLPRIVREIQDITSQVYEEFIKTGDPITDDNNTLHRFCVKLEYLLQTCIKEKTLLGGAKCYWHWMYDSLKRTKGLSDGLKFVRANKDVRTSHGRGRALVRYSLVHQTLADSFQNSLMNATTCMQYLKSDCILMNPTYAKAFVDSLYDFNAVHFDLNSKGYDLDTAWPTFASKCYHPSTDQWRAPGRSASLGSLNSLVSHVTATSLVMDNPQLRGIRAGSGSVMAYSGTGSSGPPSVDQRVEDLVLELNESDKKIQEQEIALSNLEAHAECIAKSANEKEEILARVISDLESRNQNLQDAMSHMSTEFQNREHLWEKKYQEVSSHVKEMENAVETQRQKICLLEEDKRNLEDTVSTKMSRITSGFSGTDDSDRSYLEVSTPLSATAPDSVFAESQELKQKLEASENERAALECQINSLRLDLAAMPRKIENEKHALSLSFSAKFEEQQIEWRQKLENVKNDVTSRLISEMIRVLPDDVGDEVAMQHNSTEQFKLIVAKLNDINSDFSNLRRKSKALQKNQLLQSSYDESMKLNADELMDRCNIMSLQRDEAVTEANEMKEKLIEANKQLQNYKLKLEVALSDRQHAAVELKDQNFHLQDELNSARRYQGAMAEEMRTLQQKFEATQSEAASLKERCRQLEKQIEVETINLSTLEKHLLEKTTLLDVTVAERDDFLAQLTNVKKLLGEKQEELKVVASSATESSVLQLKLQNDLAESRKEEGVAVAKMNELTEHINTMNIKLHNLKEENSDVQQQNKNLCDELDDIKAKDLGGLIEIMQQQIDDMDQKIQLVDQEKDSLKSELAIEKSKVTENVQKSSNDLRESEERCESVITNLKSNLKDTELKCKNLTENLADKDKEISDVKSSLDIEKTKLEEEKSAIRKSLEDLTGENESRKRMNKTYEKKIEKLQNENSNLIKKSSVAKDLQEKLSISEENCKVLKASLKESEGKLIGIMGSLEREREMNEQLEGQILQRDTLEEKLRNDIEDSNSVVNDLKSRLIELLQEKDALWKECDELRYFQKLQEEGDETKEKWMQDQEARYCLHCGTQFTFIVRKHHCRMCGKIFCNNCSKQWIITKNDGKRDRCCLSCLELHRNKLDIQVLSSSIKSPSTPGSTESSTSINEAQNKDSDMSFDALTEEELKEAEDSIYNEGHTTIDDSIYGTPNTSAIESEMRYHGESIIRDNDILRKNNEEKEEKVVLAGESLRVPVFISSPGTSLYWSFSTDRSIDFQLSYSTSQDDEEQPLIQRCRCNSHSEPVEGEIVTKKSGIYILEFDNRFSRFMSKDVKYMLRIKEDEMQ